MRADGAGSSARTSTPTAAGRSTTRPSTGGSPTSWSPGSASLAAAGGHNIRVAVRIRPLAARELQDLRGLDGAVEVVGNAVISRHGDRTRLSLGMEKEEKEKAFGFDVILDSRNREAPEYASQERVFQEVGMPILEDALDAYNGCLLAYGQTSSGKSYSVLGDWHTEAERGLLPRACQQLFDMVGRRRREAEVGGARLEATVLASYLEIYQEKMYDLLSNTRNDLQVRVHPLLGPHVPSLTSCPVEGIQEVNDLLDFGAKNRAVGATMMNAKSSRSHAVFTLELRLSLQGADAKDMQSKVHFVDLAGSERTKKAHTCGARLQEGIAINQSLSSLSRVIMSLANGQGNIAVFRESKLTLLLKDALSGNSRTVLLACISAATTNADETVSTLEFAARCKLIKTNAKKNEQDKRDLINNLSEEKQRIQSQLELELRQRQALQEKLDHEIRQSQENQQLANRMREEKLAIECQLRTLEEATGMRQREASEEMERLTREKDSEVQLREEKLRMLVEQEIGRYESKEEDLRRELAGLQSLSDSWLLEKQDLESQAREQKLRRERLLADLGVVGAEGLEESSQAPRLVNLHADPMLEGCLMYYLPRGETRIGASADRCRVCLLGLDVADEVCAVTNEDDTHVVVRALPGGLARVNGAAVAEAPQTLCHGDRLAIGRAHIFRVVVPLGRRSSGEQGDEEEFGRAMRELEACAEVDPLLWRGVDAAVLAVKRDCGTREANAVLDEAKAASEVVAEANAILRLVPEEWAGGVSSYELAVLLGAGGLPEVCVAARRGGGGRGASAGIWEVERFKSDRLDHMREAADLIASGPKRTPSQSGSGKGVASGGGDWEAHAWSEVPLDDFRTLARLCREQREGGAEQERARGGTLWDSLFGWGRKDSCAADSTPWLGGHHFHFWGGASFWDLLAEPHRLLAGNPPREPAAVLDQPAPQSLCKSSSLPAAMPPAPSSEQRDSSRRLPPPTPSSKAEGEDKKRAEEEDEGQGEAAVAVGPGGVAARGPRAEPRSSSHQPRRATLGTTPSCGRLSGLYAQPGTRPSGRWPASEEEPIGPDIAVAGDPGRRRTVGAAASASSSASSPSRRARTHGEVAEIRIDELFEGRLGVRLRMEGLVVSGFDVPEAREIGWRVGDEVIAVNGNRVNGKEDFRAELAKARKEMPIVFLVARLPPGTSARPPGARG